MKYALLLLSLVTLQTHAQIIYTDVVPDSVFADNGDTCHLDLNNDGTDDFLIRLNRSTGSCPSPCSGPPYLLHPSSVSIDPMPGSAVSDTLVQQPMMLAPLRVIDASLAWETTTSQSLSSFSVHCITFMGEQVCAHNLSGGQWQSGLSVDSSRYLGLSFTAAGSTHYGWARISIPHAQVSISSFTLKDYAYNSVPDEFILAGEGADISTGIAGITRSSVQVFPNPTSGKFTIEGLDKSRVTSIEIRNAIGQGIQRSEIKGEQTGIDLSSQPSGIYFLTIRMAEQVISRKLIKQ